MSLTEVSETPAVVPGATTCRSCRASLDVTVVDLGMSPLCQSFLRGDQLEQGEAFYPLHVRVCLECGLAQLPAFVPREDIFTEYAYFSAYSTSWVEHSRRYVEMMVDRLQLGPSSFVVEIASNDGYLLQHFVGREIPVLGIDPAENVAPAAEDRGVPTLTEFFGAELARRVVADESRADLVIGNNVLAQVPDLNDFVSGVEILLGPEGIATFEFPHLARLLEHLEYDTIYHEHFSYFSLRSIVTLFGAHGLAVVDVEELPSHGGSLRVYAAHARRGQVPTDAVARVLAAERSDGLDDPRAYQRFADAVQGSKRALLEVLLGFRNEGRQIAGYGAPGKGNTLLNYCGIRTDLIDYLVDRNPYKQGLFTPGTHIPIYAPERLEETRPDVIVVLPWNLIGEIGAQLAYTASWGAELVVPIPTATIVAPG